MKICDNDSVYLSLTPSMCEMCQVVVMVDAPTGNYRSIYLSKYPNCSVHTR